MPESEATHQARAALGRQLALLRRAAGYNQYRLAEELPYSRSTVANVEIGRQNVPLDFWQRCDELLGSDGALVRGHEEIQLLVRRDAENGACQVALQRQLAFVTTQGDHGSALAPIARVALHDIRRGQHGDHASQLFAAMDAVRNHLERSLVGSSVTAGQLDDLEEMVVAHAHDCVRLPPVDMLCRLTLDTADVRGLLARPQPPQTGLRLRRISAGLAVLMADELMVLGDVYAARSWYATARHAADITEDNALRATIYTLSAMLPLYWGRPAQAIKIGIEARELGEASSGMASAMAPSIEAFALAKIGNREMSARVLECSTMRLRPSSGWPPANVMRLIHRPVCRSVVR